VPETAASRSLRLEDWHGYAPNQNANEVGPHH
jgi:hypothetical protein